MCTDGGRQKIGKTQIVGSLAVVLPLYAIAKGLTYKSGNTHPFTSPLNNKQNNRQHKSEWFGQNSHQFKSYVNDRFP